MGGIEDFSQIYSIGVVGIYGKTTAKLVKDFFGKDSDTEILINSSKIFNHDGKKNEEYNKIFKDIKQHGIKVVIMEITSDDIEKLKSHKLEFDSIIHTNTCLSKTHTDLHLQFINNRPFQLLKKDGMAIINIDADEHIQLIDGLENRIVISYGLSSKATLTASSIETSSQVLKYNCCLQRSITNKNDVEVDPMEFPVRIPMESYHIHNSLAAIAQVLLLGVPPELFEGQFSEAKKFSL